MQTVDESTMDDVITTVDFATLFRKKSLRQNVQKEKTEGRKIGFYQLKTHIFLFTLSPYQSQPSAGVSKFLWAAFLCFIAVKISQNA